MATTLGLAGLLLRNESLGVEMILNKVTNYYGYTNGIKNGAIEGYKYTVVLPARNFAQLDVKIPGAKILDVRLGEHFPVVFDELEVKIYYDNNHKAQLTARVSNVKRVERK